MDNLSNQLAAQVRELIAERLKLQQDYNQLCMQYRDDLKDSLDLIKHLQAQRDKFKQLFLESQAAINSYPSSN